jgi:2-polyprenyl-6-hydroxyphenyl methylase/3-demethylubiquinone-9 3-methyltransferase
MDYVRLKHERGALEFMPGDIFRLEALPKYDVVLATEVIEHVAHPDAFLVKIARLVRPGGFVVLTTPNGEYFRNTLPRFSDTPNPERFEAIQFRPDADGHIFLLHEDEMRHFASKAGLELVSLQVFSSFLTSGHMGTERLLKVLPRSVVDAGERVATSFPWKIRKYLSTGVGALLQRPAGSQIGSC